MDPNATLAQIRRWESYRQEYEQKDKFADADRMARQIAEAVQALDEWITGGGFLPGDWRK